MGLRIASQSLYEPMTAAAYSRYGIDGLPYKTWLDYDAAHRPPTFHIFSAALVPPARDWHPSLSVTGAIVDPASRRAPLEAAGAEEAEAEERLPPPLRAYIAAAKCATTACVNVLGAAPPLLAEARLGALTGTRAAPP